jgi:hypothetical protein
MAVVVVVVVVVTLAAVVAVIVVVVEVVIIVVVVVLTALFFYFLDSMCNPIACVSLSCPPTLRFHHHCKCYLEMDRAEQLCWRASSCGD